MIPRYQRILFWILGAAILLMALVLLRGCEQAREKLTRHRDETPLAAPVATASEKVRLAIANDSDGSISVVEREVALPAETTARSSGRAGPAPSLSPRSRAAGSTRWPPAPLPA